MMGNDIILGKGTSSELEALHGKVTKIYSKAMNNLADRLEDSEEAMLNYKEAIRLAEEAGESTDDIVMPYNFTIDKDALALLKNAQSFLKENDIQVDVKRGAIGGKRLRKDIAKQIAEKLDSFN